MEAAVHRGYGEGAVYGSLAYDFNNPELYPEQGYGLPEQEQHSAQETASGVQVKTRARAVPRSRQSLAPFAIVGGLVAAFLLVTAITDRVGLMSVSGESVALQAQLAELEDQHSRLQIAYESAFNLAEIETYATTSLGMQKPSADQITYIDTSASDRAVVLAQGESEGFVDRASDLLSGLGTYFR